MYCNALKAFMRFDIDVRIPILRNISHDHPNRIYLIVKTNISSFSNISLQFVNHIYKIIKLKHFVNIVVIRIAFSCSCKT